MQSDAKNNLKMSISGVRGIYGESLTEDIARNFGYAFGQYVQGGKVVIGRDTRTSGESLKHAVCEGLASAGTTEIFDVDIDTTPTVQIMVREKGAAGGIMISASHNPIEWNGLKFISADGIFLDEVEVQKFFQVYENIEQFESKKTTTTSIENASLIHTQKVLAQFKSEQFNKNLKVVVDCCNGSGAIANPIFFKELGIDAIFINDKPDGNFARIPEPLPENLGMLGDAVRKHGADIGFAQDPDADRLAIVDEKGNPIGEEYSLVLASKYMLAHSNDVNKTIVTNLSTSRMIDDVAEKFDAKVIRTKIGEVYVSKKMKEIGATCGGEGNGGVIFGAVGLGRDSLSGMALILALMSETSKKVSELVADIPHYEVVKTKKEVSTREEVEAILKKTKSVYSRESLDETDGVKVIFPNGWLHVRASNTEPIVRFYAEAPTKAEAQGWIDKIF